MDKTLTNAVYEIDIDRKTMQPKTIRLSVMAGTKGETEKKGKKIVGGKHVAMHFTYKLSSYGKVDRPDIPAEARRLLARN